LQGKWLAIHGDEVMKLIWPDGFEQVGVPDPLYARGLCSVCDLLAYEVDGKVRMLLFLLWKKYPVCCEVRFWFDRGIGHHEMIEGLREAKQEFKDRGVKFAFFFCRKQPNKITGQKIGAIMRKLPIGCMYEWEFK
jgi:hypothetical protein